MTLPSTLLVDYVRQMERSILSTLHTYVEKFKFPCSQNDKLVAQKICFAILRRYWILLFVLGLNILPQYPSQL